MKRTTHYLLILTLFIVPLIFCHATTDIYGMIKVKAIELAALVLLVLWLLEKFSTHSLRPFARTLAKSRSSRLTRTVLLFLVIACISLFNAINIYAGLEALYLLTACIAIFFVVLNSTKSVRDVRRLIISIILAGAAACLWSIYQNKGVSFSALRFVYASTFGNPIFFSQYLSAIIPLSIVLFFERAKRVEKPASDTVEGFSARPLRVLARTVLAGVFYLAAAALSLLFLIVARSRGAYLGLACAFFYCYIVILVRIFFEQGKKASRQARRIFFAESRRIFLVLSIAGIILAIGASAILWPKVRSGIDARQLQNMMRVHVWQGSLGMIKDRPFLGAGIGNFEYAYPLYRTEKEKEVTPKGVKYTKAHNEALQIASQMGVFGLLAFLGILWCAFFPNILRAKPGSILGQVLDSPPTAPRLNNTGLFFERSREAFFLATGIKAALIALLVQSLFNPMLGTPTSGLLFWALLALLQCSNNNILRASEVSRETASSVAEEFSTGLPRAESRGSNSIAAISDILRGTKSTRITAGTLAAAIVFLAPINIFKPLVSDYFLEKAQVREADGDMKTALANLEKSTQAYPHNWEALFLFGKIYQNMGSYNEAVKYYEKATRYHPNYPLIWNNLGTACMQANLTTRAIKAFKCTIEIDDRYIGAHYNLALAFSRNNQPDMVDQEMQKVNSLDPTFIGNMYLESGIFDEAAIHFHKAIQRNPDNIEAHFKLAQVWHRRNETDKAILRYKKTVQLQPMYVEAHISLAELYKDKKDLDNAIISYEEALEAIPNKIEGLARDISLYSDLGIYTQVLEKFDEIEELKGVKLDVYRGLAGIYSAKGQSEKAMESYEELVKELARDPSIWEELAGIYEKQGMYEEAKDAYSKIIEINPKRKETLEAKLLLLNKIAAHHALAKIYQAQAMHDKAAVEYKKVMDVDPENIYTMRKLAQIYTASAVIASEQGERSNFFLQAEKMLAKILEIAENDVDALLAMGDLFVQTGRLAEAEQAYIKVIDTAPFDSRGPLGLAGLYRKGDRLDEAEAIYKKAIQALPEDVHLCLNLATLMEERGDIASAIHEYKEVLRIDQDNKEARIRLEVLGD